MRVVNEPLEAGPIPLARHPEWAERFPWMQQGTTGTGPDRQFNLGAFGDAPVGDVLSRWKLLRDELGVRTTLHAHQVHGREIGVWSSPLPESTIFVHGLDGHVTDQPGLLLAVSVADCVPVFVVDADARRIAAIHSGWRGVAAGATEAAIEKMVELGSRLENLHVHCGPAICGKCYEVGPEVHQGVHPDRTPPQTNTPIDLRAAILARVEALGVPGDQLTVSEHCTLCGPGSFFSHRGADPARQMGVIALVAEGSAA